jgi:hypothetical protein
MTLPYGGDTFVTFYLMINVLQVVYRRISFGQECSYSVVGVLAGPKSHSRRTT